MYYKSVLYVPKTLNEPTSDGIPASVRYLVETNFLQVDYRLS
jgi:hypothetical protein